MRTKDLRVYVLLDVVNGKSEQVTQSLRGKPGVVIVDLLEGPPDVIMVVEASERQKLAELTTQALASVETMTEGLQLLPVQYGLNNHGIVKPSRRGSK